MRYPEGKGIRSSQWYANEILRNDDINFLNEKEYTNQVASMAMMVLPATFDGTTEAVVLSGLTIEHSTLLTMTLNPGAALSSEGYYLSGGTWGFVASAGDLFGVVVPESISVAVLSGGAQDRIDVVEIRPVRSSYDEKSRTFKDPITGLTSTAPIDTKVEYTYEFQVLQGTEAASPVAPSRTSGWIKLAEVYVASGVTSITDSDITLVNDSASWTTESSSTTPLITDFVNTLMDDPDGASFFQTIVDSATEKVLRQKIGVDWEWTSPAQIGSGLAISDIYNAKITALNDTDIALIAAASSTTFDVYLTTYRFDGSTWSQIGSTLEIVDGAEPFITALNGTDIAYIDLYNDDLRTYRFDGSTWSQVGSELHIEVGNATLTALNGTDIALWDNRDLKVYRFDGSTWSQVGSTFTINPGSSGSMDVSMTALNGTDIVYCNDFDDVLEVYRFDGSTWSQVGPTLSISVSSPSIVALNGTDFALIDGNNEQLRMYSFNGSTWERVVYGLPLPSDTPSITALNGTDIAYINDPTDNLQTYRFGFHLSGMKPHALSWI